MDPFTFELQRRIKKREMQIEENNREIKRLQGLIEKYKDKPHTVMIIRQYENRIKLLKNDNQVMEGKNKRFIW